MNDVYDIYSWFWDSRYGVDFQEVSGKVDIEELWLRSRLLMLNKDKRKAREEYIGWFKPEITLKNKKQLADTVSKVTSSNLSRYSILIKINFKLKKPYLSKDDDNFYIIDNPIVKDKVFKLPMVRATTWKGALRFAAMKVFEKEFNKSNWKEARALLVRLFGNEKDSLESYLNKFIASKLGKDVNYVKEEFEKYLVEKGYVSEEIPSRAGRLFFYPTFFEKISLDVITPLSRKTKTPTRGPIYFEVVKGDGDTFRLLYYPFDLIARGKLERIKEEMKEDLKFLAKALKKMFFETSFSAKKSSGFGAVEQINDSDIEVNGFKSDEVKNIIKNILS